MKVVILAGGYGTRISEESNVRPKPMVEIGGKPMLWHIMKIFSAAGLNDFIICLGYKGYMVKEYFANYMLHVSDIVLEFNSNSMQYVEKRAEPWRVSLIDTGEQTMTGGRLKRVQKYIGDEPFCLTYGDGLIDLDINKVIDFHRQQKTLATLTAVQPPGRFGAFTLCPEKTRIIQFREKSKDDGAWINGGFFVLEPQVLDYIEGDSTIWEREPMTRLAHEGQLSAYRHQGFWQNMDTLRDKNLLEDMWSSGKPPWKIWQESHQ
jgi:glucose-1-phosphate cytidylyltransferase